MRNPTILVIFPDRNPAWEKVVAGLTAKLPDHTIHYAHDLWVGDGYIADADVLLSFGLAPKSAELASKLRWIQAMGSGMDLFPTLPRGIVLTNMRGVGAVSVAEGALTAILLLARNVPQALGDQRARRWRPMPARLLSGAVLGILGVGAIAEELARRCKALGMRVEGISRRKGPIEGFDEIHPRDRLIEAVSRFDYFVLLSPPDSDTSEIVNEELLHAMKREAFLVNVGRGRLVDEAALENALKQGIIAGAALDVFSTEPLPEDHPFWGCPNLIVTPHTAGRYVSFPDDLTDLFVRNLAAFEAGRVDEMTNIMSVKTGE